MTNSSQQRTARPARVLHLTDPHLFGSADGELRGTNTLASLQAVIEHFQVDQILTALPEAMRVLTSPVDTGAVTISLPEDVQATASALSVAAGARR